MTVIAILLVGLAIWLVGFTVGRFTAPENGELNRKERKQYEAALRLVDNLTLTAAHASVIPGEHYAVQVLDDINKFKTGATQL